jgi:hypothetical protein
LLAESEKKGREGRNTKGAPTPPLTVTTEARTCTVLSHEGKGMKDARGVCQLTGICRRRRAGIGAIDSEADGVIDRGINGRRIHAQGGAAERREEQRRACGESHNATSASLDCI